MKKMLPLIISMFFLIGCVNNNKEEKIRNILGIEISNEPISKSQNLLIDYYLYSKDECKFTFIYENKDLIGFKVNNEKKCVSLFEKVINSNIFVRYNNKNNNTLTGEIVDNYIIRRNSIESSIIKKRKPTTLLATITLMKELGLPIIEQKQYNKDNDPDKLLGTNNSYYDRVSFNDNDIIKNKVENYQEQNDLTQSEVINESLSKQLDNSLLIFRNNADLDSRYEELLQKMKNDSQQKNIDKYLVKKGKFLFVLSTEMSENKVDKYTKVFNSIFE